MIVLHALELDTEASYELRRTRGHHLALLSLFIDVFINAIL